MRNWQKAEQETRWRRKEWERRKTVMPYECIKCLCIWCHAKRHQKPLKVIIKQQKIWSDFDKCFSLELGSRIPGPAVYWLVLWSWLMKW
jgi:hypothetical protein